MKEYLKFIVLGILVVFVISSALFMYQDITSKPKDSRIEEARRKTKEQDIYWYSTANKIAYIAILIVALACVVILTYSIAKSHLKKASVHTYKIGKHSEIDVHEKDLSSLAAPVAIGLTQAEQLKQQNKGLQQAFAINAQMAELQAKQIQAVVGKRGVAPVPASVQQEQPAALVDASRQGQDDEIPSFHKLLISGEIAPGKSMILGYEHGEPRRGSFLDIYSAAVAGESGSGKTSTMLFLIGSGLVTCGVRFIGIDPHYPHPKSLGAKTKPLWEAGLMQMGTSQPDIIRILQKVEALIDRRLKQLDQDTTPVVLVIDELAFLSKTPIGRPIAHTMERISTEGRKCEVYMLASSQTWLAARTGNSSVVRDTLTSAYVHRIKPKQANLLLQDKDEVHKVKKYIKQAGEVLFCPVNDDSTVCRMPYTTEADVMMVAEMLQSQHTEIFPQSDPLYMPVLPDQYPQIERSASADTSASSTIEIDSEPENRMIAAPARESLNTSAMMAAILRERMEASPLDETSWRQQISHVSGVSEKLLTNVLEGSKELTLQTTRKLIGKMTTADPELQNDATLMVVGVLRKYRDTSTLDERTWHKHVSRAAGVSETLLKDLVEGKKDLSAQTAKKLLPYLFSGQI